MQLYALQGSSLLSAHDAEKGIDYICPECLGSVRCKRGGKKTAHFYHRRSASLCRQQSKSRAHLQIQLHLKSLIPDAELESKVQHRIADVLWQEHNIIFEIQYSPIRCEEVQQRCQDYQNNGYTVIWILHDKEFNQKKLSPAEDYLRKENIAFFTNGYLIYDQIETLRNKIRIFKGKMLPIDITQPKWQSPFQCSFPGDASHHNTYPIQHRSKRFVYRLLKKLTYRLLELTTT